MSTWLLVSLIAPVAADTPVELVPRGNADQWMQTTVSTKGAAITPDAFAAAILDGDSYPMSASYMGVDALEVCQTLERRDDGSAVVYQRTGGNFVVKSRHYVILLQVTELTATDARIEWDLVKHAGSAGAWQGPFASALNGSPDAVYTPYNHGYWDYDQAAGTITYAVQSNPGGSVPEWMVSEGAVMAFPLELLDQKWGVRP